MSKKPTAESATILGWQPDLLTILAILLLSISGWFEQIMRDVFAAVPARPSSIRLGTPLLVAMSDSEAADAAHLLGVSVAALMALDGMDR